MGKINLGEQIRHVHMIGIGGVSMSALGEILLRDGYTVSGSDAVDSDATRRLVSLGAAVHIGNSAAHITDGIDMVVYTAAVTPDNPEYQAAQTKGLLLLDRARLLKRMMTGYAYTVCVAGTHGKTGTTALIADACLTAGLDPTILVGGYMGEGYNYRVGQSPYFIMEACEYFDSFLQWYPYVGVILNIDCDHMDYFGNMARLIDSFAQFAQNIPAEGTLVIYGGTPELGRIVDGLACRVLTYGVDGADFTARNLSFDQKGRPTFDIYHRDAFHTSVRLPLYGAHNALNALAAAAVCQVLGMTPETARRGLESARGTRRRFEFKGVFNGAEVMDDYAHHPTEIKATLAAARAGKQGGERGGKLDGQQNDMRGDMQNDAQGDVRSDVQNDAQGDVRSDVQNDAQGDERGGQHDGQHVTPPSGRIICAFQPHTYSRTEQLLDDFAQSFGDADWVVVLPIFASREAFDGRQEGHVISSRHLAEKIAARGQSVYYADDFDDGERFLRETVMPNDLLITMGAGDVYLLGERLFDKPENTV